MCVVAVWGCLSLLCVILSRSKAINIVSEGGMGRIDLQRLQQYLHCHSSVWKRLKWWIKTDLFYRKPEPPSARKCTNISCGCSTIVRKDIRSFNVCIYHEKEFSILKFSSLRSTTVFFRLYAIGGSPVLQYEQLRNQMY